MSKQHVTNLNEKVISTKTHKACQTMQNYTYQRHHLNWLTAYYAIIMFLRKSGTDGETSKQMDGRKEMQYRLLNM